MESPTIELLPVGVMEVSTSTRLDEPSTASHAEPEEDSPSKLKGAKQIRIQKIVQTLILYIGFFSLGLAFCIVGPTLLDLQRNTRTSTEAISMVFIARSVVGLCGAVLAGFTVGRINYWLLLSMAMATLGPLKILMPHMLNIWSLLALFALSGGAGSLFNAGGNMVLLKVWGKENGPWMQALHCIFGCGALSGPLLAEPFLRSREDVRLVMNETFYTEDSNVVYKEYTNYSLEVISENISVTSPDNLKGVSREFEYESKVHWAYLIVGVIVILASVLFLGIAICCSDIELRCLNRIRKSEMTEGQKQVEHETEDKAFRMQMIALVFFFYLTYCILELNYGNYLTVFAVKGLGWSEKEGARVTAAYWASFTVGRGIGIILVKFLTPWVLLTGDLIISSAALFTLAFFSYHHYLVLWICTLTLGLGISTIFATGITWTEQYIQITGVAGAVFIIAGAGSEMIGPIVIGTLFTSVGPRTFLYVMCSAICLLVLLFVVMQFLGRHHGMRKRSDPTMESTALHEHATNTGRTLSSAV